MNNLDDMKNQDLGELPGEIYLKIRDHLDASPSELQAFVASLDGYYSMSQSDWMTASTSRSPTSNILDRLKSMGMTIENFAYYAVLARNSFVMNLLQLNAPVCIKNEPCETTYTVEGQPLELIVQATGYPAPTYQWSKDGVQLPGANQGTFRVNSTSMQDAGTYQCAVYSRQNNAEISCLVIVEESAPIMILQHPCTCRAELGGNALFRCEASAASDVQYQWYRDSIPLQDTTTVKGSVTNELRLYSLDKTCQGQYCCVVSSGCQEVYTSAASLQLVDSLCLYEQTHNYTATDKVALLIGCYDYRGDKVLKAPMFDVQTLAKEFKALNFKVVSLLNLNKLEMISAIHEFKQLVGEGVYCVFYFCGHGFEIPGHCFLVPVDAPNGYDHTHCVAADLVFSVLLDQKPKICCMILDTCRKIREEFKPVNFTQGPVLAGNIIVIYGTSFGLAAYEGGKYGILVNYLEKILRLPISIEEVFRRLREALGKDHRVRDGKHKQIPDMKTNLTEPSRSFSDRIVYSGFTSQYNRHRAIWERAHIKPDPRVMEVQFEGFTVKFRLDFEQEFSNKLKIIVTVVDPGPSSKCIAYVSGVPMEVAEKTGVTLEPCSSNGGLYQSSVPIRNIQRLKSNMKITVTVTCEYSGLPLKSVTTDYIDLDLPLVASLELWRERPGLTCHRVAVEQEENSL